MSLKNNKIRIETSGGGILIPHSAYRATLESYEPGDPIGWGATPLAAVDDLYEQLDMMVMTMEALNPPNHLM